METGPRWPAALSLLLLAGLVALDLHSFLSVPGREFVYALDDPYIHLSIARNLVENGQWGLQSGEFAAASSSPLWTLLLAIATGLSGVRVFTPFVLCAGFAVLLVLVADRWLGECGLATTERAAALLVLVLATPLPALVATGLEHLLQILVLFLLLTETGKAIEQPGRELRLLALAALAGAVRYDDAFAVAGVACVLLLARRWSALLAVLLGAASPVLLFGAYSMFHGSGFLPNSILIKAQETYLSYIVLGNQVYAESWLGSWMPTRILLIQAERGPHLVGLLALGILLLWSRRRRHAEFDGGQAMLSAYLVCLALHFYFGAIDVIFFRYDAYLVALGILLTARELSSLRRLDQPPALRIPLMLAATFLLSFLGLRTVDGLESCPRAHANVFGQQWQMARLVRDLVPGETVAVNDLGAVSFAGGVRVFDLWGLASDRVRGAKLSRRYPPALRAELCDQHGVRLVLVYEWFFHMWGGLPEQWIPLGALCIRDNRVCAADRVQLYATTREAAEELGPRIDAWAATLPPGSTWVPEGQAPSPARRPAASDQEEG